MRFREVEPQTDIVETEYKSLVGLFHIKIDFLLN